MAGGGQQCKLADRFTTEVWVAGTVAVWSTAVRLGRLALVGLRAGSGNGEGGRPVMGKKQRSRGRGRGSRGWGCAVTCWVGSQVMKAGGSDGHESGG